MLKLLQDLLLELLKYGKRWIRPSYSGSDPISQFQFYEIGITYMCARDPQAAFDKYAEIFGNDTMYINTVHPWLLISGPLVAGRSEQMSLEEIARYHLRYFPELKDADAFRLLPPENWTPYVV